MRELTPILVLYLDAKKQGDERAWDAKRWAISENQKLAGKVRSIDRLFVTDVGKCHRQVKYRLTGEDARPSTPAKQLMFELADDIETTVAAAMKWAGILQDYQGGVSLDDRENWGGRTDIIIDDGGIELKTSMSNAFKGFRADDMPKPDHLRQAGVYEHYVGVAFSLLYVDRGGQNAPQQFEVPALDWDATSAQMDALDDVRMTAGLPDCLPLVITRKNWRKSHIDLGQFSIEWSGEVYLGPDWRCGSYCPYDKCPAKRKESKMLAKMTKKDPIVLTHDGQRHEDDLYRYLRSGQKEMRI
jgi:hypothetical protein